MPKGTKPDNRRWLGLVVLAAGLFIVILDQTVLNVAIPSILKDFDTNLSSLQWVISGYSLIFASLLITFGRLGDLFGRRLIFLIGAALFGIGSLVASISTSSTSLFIGEALIEGIGAAMMLPSTLSLITSEFSGRERGIAFAVWGAIAGSAGAFGPLVGGYLTTYHSWRWAFRVNVVVAPLAILGAMLFIRESKILGKREKLDLPGVITVSLGLFGIVFALIEGATYGWLKPLREFTIGNFFTWPYQSFSVVTFALALGLLLLGLFYSIEQDKESANASPLFSFSLFRIPSFRYGILTTTILALGEFGLVFVLPIFLQTTRQLSAFNAGLWGLPLGVAAFCSAPLAGFLSTKFGPKWVISTGMALEAIAIFYASRIFTPSTSAASLAPSLILYGIGIGFATTQLVNVVLNDVPNNRAGAASGMNGTVRQIGSALGIAVIGAILTAQIASHARSLVTDSTVLPEPAKATISSSFDTAGGNNLQAPPSIATNPAAQSIASEVASIIRHATALASQDAALFASAMVLVGAGLSLLIPNIEQDHNDGPSELPLGDNEGFAI